MMPTFGRPEYVAESIAMFLAQDYPAKELIILNDCPGQILTGDFPDVRIINAKDRYSHLGDKRNAIIEEARGDLIAVWDDDDVYLPWRLSYSVAEMEAHQTGLYFPAEYWAYWGDLNLHDNHANANWISHPAYLFRRDLWREAGKYPPRTLGEDSVLAWKMLAKLGLQWPNFEVPRVDRVLVLRGRSQFHHTSFQGGEQAPNTASGTVELVPRPIADPVLRTAVEGLIERKRTADSYRMAIAQREADSRHDRGGCTYLDDLTPHVNCVGYGGVGVHGSLGYEGKSVEICGQRWMHAVSSHGPARLVYPLDGRFATFSVEVALNDDVAPLATSADFRVLVDGQLVTSAEDVRPHEMPRRLRADVRQGRELELVVEPRRWDSCHTVWVEPVLETVSDGPEERWLRDGLDRAEFQRPLNVRDAEVCIATVGSPGFEDWIDDLLGSIVAHGQCPEALLAIFSFGDSPAIRRIAAKYEAVVVPCRPLRTVDMSCKSVLYAAAHALPAHKFVCLDADMLVLDDLRPLIASLTALPPGAILVARDAEWNPNLESALRGIYRCTTSLEDLAPVFGGDLAHDLAYPLVVNDGLFAGTGAALRAIDDSLRTMPGAAAWIDDPAANCPWRNQFVFNLALARSRCAVELDPRYNVQLRRHSPALVAGPHGEEWQYAGRKVAVAHFNGEGKALRPKWRARFRAAERPLVGLGSAGGYEQFVAALRTWIGQVGLDALAWSFYGTTDGLRGSVPDSMTFPLLAALHYLVRSNGCERILETGTARGVSAACLASAVAHRDNPVVVTLDSAAFPERESLWAQLPQSIRKCIEPRREDALAGMRNALERGERYHAALLDTIHTAEHVLQEFDLASQLVCPGGLILIHDATFAPGTVGAALDEIQDRGYGVVRLWTAECGAREDDALGLAVVENRRSAKPLRSVRGETFPTPSCGNSA